ncbi:two-component regulator propeller domain-containing protein [Pontibacter pamirensis]|uniref:two-component regulator propeller domain-containing protein n=1 Tax=Pontibacter pamirensis TaxID=2562824 RepID=UPI00138A556F|nr:two-component regulator propeller domain-containing protein [Pontibacter pamirensis]
MKTLHPLFILVSLLLLSCLNLSSAQQVAFKRVAPLEGLSYGGFVTGMTQDQQGYMWFSKQTGLFRYNGYQWVVYKNDVNDPGSLAANWTECVHADKEGSIWIGTFGHGLDRLNPATGKFTHFTHNPSDKKSLSSDTVTVILEDHEGVLWIGTHNGLNRYHPATGTFTHYMQDKDDPYSLSNNQVRALYEDRQGTLWVGTGSPFPGETPKGEGGLNRFNRTTGKFQRYMHDPENPNTLIDNKVRAILEDSEGVFWVGTYGDGLHTMNREEGTFERHLYDPEQPEKLSRPYLKSGKTEDGITFIHEDAAGTIWIGSYRGGLNRYNPETKKVKHFEYSKNVPHNLEDNGTWYAYTSREGVLWISTWGGDIYRVNPFQKVIPYVEMGTSVSAFYEDSSGILWLGTEKGIFRKQPHSNSMEHFAHDAKNPNSLSDNNVFDIKEDRQGVLWIGTEEGGLNRFNRSTETFTAYRHDPGQSGSISSNTVIAILEDKKGALWIGTTDGLDRFDAQNSTFKHYLTSDSFTNKGVQESMINCLSEDSKGNLWIGIYHGGEGLYYLNQTTNKFTRYLEGEDINNVYEDAAGVVWAGTDNGLFRLHPGSGSFEPFLDPFTSKGVSTVIHISEDKQQNLWISASAGLIRLNRTRDVVGTYGWNYGINPSAFTYGGHRGRGGEIFIGDMNGYYSFLPAQIGLNNKAPEIIFTDFRLFDQSVKPGKGQPFQVPLSEVKEIQLPYKENVFSLSFAGIHYISPEANRHLYKLQNYDDVWRIAGPDRTASYFKVPPGKYVFYLKVANSDGEWSEKNIAILVNPPWWSTWWAIGLYVLAFGGIIWGAIEYRSSKLKCENRVLEQKVQARTTEVMAQNDEILEKNRKIKAQHDRMEQTLEELQSTQSQLIQSEKMASLGELTAGIAHEIQNPLNFVNNFSEVSVELCAELGQELDLGRVEVAQSLIGDLARNLHKIQQHGRRADSIVKGMLQHSRANAGHKEPTDLNALADEYLRLSYHGLKGKDKGFNVRLIKDFDPAVEKVEVVPQEIGRVFLNLFNNAFYAVQQRQVQDMQGYVPEVRVSTRQLEGRVEVRVRDNGTGIAGDLKDKIFQPFFTTKPSGEGTGLGLSLSYEIITKGHGGKLQVDTEKNEYAEFIISLPVRDLVAAEEATV